MVNSNIVVSFHNEKAMKGCLENDEIEKQLKCEICGEGLCFLGSFKEGYTKGRFSCWTRG
jgi:hypothetical protein